MPIHTDQPAPDLQLFELTYAPGHKPTGTPVDPQASRQVLRERRTTQVHALDSDGAISLFERESQRMVTACKRVQLQATQS